MKLNEEFFNRDALEVAPNLIGKIIARKLDDGTILRERIAETEVYRGEEDLGCHASKGRTKRTELLYGESGVIYVYLCYGMHWLMNVITGEREQPQGVLFRCGTVKNGPAKLTKYLQIDDGFRPKITTAPRVGIDYAGEYWKNVKWRYIAEKE